MPIVAFSFNVSKFIKKEYGRILFLMIAAKIIKRRDVLNTHTSITYHPIEKKTPTEMDKFQTRGFIYILLDTYYIAVN